MWLSWYARQKLVVTFSSSTLLNFFFVQLKSWSNRRQSRSPAFTSVRHFSNLNHYQIDFCFFSFLRFPCKVSFGDEQVQRERKGERERRTENPSLLESSFLALNEGTKGHHFYHDHHHHQTHNLCLECVMVVEDVKERERQSSRDQKLRIRKKTRLKATSRSPFN